LQQVADFLTTSKIANAKTMFILTASVVIKKPIDLVFNFMLDAGNYPRWITMLKSVNVKGNFITGMRFEEVTLLRGKEKHSQGVISEVVPNKLIKMEILEVISGPRVLPVRTWEFTEENGATEIIWTTIVRTKGMMKLFEFILPQRFDKTVRRFLQNLKQILENG